MKRVLIVDDAIDLGRLLQDALRTAHPGMPITIVPSGEEALLESTRLNIDLLVTDLRLPGMSGIELVRKIRIRQPNIKVMVITGINIDSRTQKQLDDLKIDVFRRKPLGMSDFLELTGRLLEIEEPEKPVEQAEPKAAVSSEEALRKVLADAPLPGEPVMAARKAAGKTGPLPAAEDEGLSGRLSGLRSSLSALAVLLLDERGHVVAQAGDLPEPGLVEQLVAPLFAALSAGARLSYLLGQPATESVSAFRGKTVDLVTAPIGQYALLLAVRPGRSALRLALAFEEVLAARVDLAGVLDAMGLRVQVTAEVAPAESAPDDLETVEEKSALPEPGAPETPAASDPGLEKFEEIFLQDTTVERKLPDADSFWDSVSDQENENLDTSSPGMLSYEQAQKLGLLPKEEDQ